MPGSSPDGTAATDAGVGLALLTSNLASVALTLPTFWSQNPDAWFVKVEAQLKSANITSEETAFYKVLAVLPESAAIKVRDISLKPKYEKGDYGTLKQKLIAVAQQSTLERLDRLCELRNISHKKPSDVLTELESLFHSSQTDKVMPMNSYMKKFWWLRALPHSIQQCLLPVAEMSTLASLVLSADQMYSANPPVESVTEIQRRSDYHEMGDQDDSLHSEQSPDLEVSALNNKQRAPPFKTQRKEPLYCKYHLKFGDRARRCAVGCSRYGLNQKN